MQTQFTRTQRILGENSMNILKNARIAVFGIGGVGGFVCEALVRSGVGAFDLIDNDTVSVTNINRQIIATHRTVGRFKTEVMRERMIEINPDADIRIHTKFFLHENAGEFPFEEYDYVVDAVDTVAAKLEIATICSEKEIPLISSMGTGNKIEASALKVADIKDTKMCPLAKVMRKELRKRGISTLKVVYSEEIPMRSKQQEAEENISSVDACSCAGKRDVPGSVAFVPSTAGMIIAGEVVKALTGMSGSF
ncbi:MAG: tRNA threonylcarbamoyladenosine dehydratase [Clostridia bacterium]|nr:tRNA threonylcarbamoyladenosine dehydratase [Clostridia bacterium]